MRIHLLLVALLVFEVLSSAQTVGPASRTPSVEQLQKAQWVEGRVVLPKDVPADERLVVTADATGLAEFDQMSVDVGADGRFRVAFAADATRGHVRLMGRYLFLDSSSIWISGETKGPIELHPVVGGLLRGHVKVNGAEARETAEVLATSVELEGTPLAPGSVAVRRSVRIDDDFAYEAPALPKGYQWTVALVAGPFAPLVADVADVSPGQTMTADLVLTRGARLRGRVLDADGGGVAGATVHVISHGDPLAPEPADCGKVHTGGDGSFEIRGVPVGDATVWSAREGWISEQGVITGLKEGDTRDGVSLKLRAGNVLSGKVLDPKGGPAAGARVRVTQSSLGQADVVREIVTGADGSFSASGLGDEPVDVLVTRESMSQDLKPKGSAKKRVLRATAMHVAAGAHDLVITLVAGMVIEGRVHDDMGRLVQSFTLVARREALKDKPAVDDVAAFRTRDVRDRDGLFVLDDLEPGMWDVWIAGRGIVSEGAQRVQVPFEGDSLRFIVRRPAVVNGVVLDAQKKPMADVLVEASWDHPALFVGAPTHGSTSVTCGPDGKFELTAVYPGAVRLEANTTDGSALGGADLKLESGETRADVEIVMVPGAPR